MLGSCGRLDLVFHQDVDNPVRLLDADGPHFVRCISAKTTTFDDCRAADAEACFGRAIEVARGQETRWLWLKAAMSLARLELSQGRTDEARMVLKPVCSWFTEGFDTPDLKDAKALLEEQS